MSQIIGTGMIAKEMNIPFDVIIFASGVSNSQCVSNMEFEREIELFKNIKKNKKIIYFSTVTVHQNQKTPYILHKTLMETLIEKLCKNYLILRLPNLIGSVQSNNQLIPSLIKQITNGEVTIQKNAKRCILDVEDLPIILENLIEKTGAFDIFGRPVLLEDLVHYISDILRVNPKINLIPPIDYPDLKITINLDDDYYKKILKKYCFNI